MAEKIVYNNDTYYTELRVDFNRGTILATQEQIAQLFDTQRPAITKHIMNIFRSKELRESSVCSILEQTAKDGKKYRTKFYNLDCIISIGYRVNSKKATLFRIWATDVLRNYLLEHKTNISTDVPEVIDGLHDALTLISSKKYSGKLKGKITLRLTRNLEHK